MADKIFEKLNETSGVYFEGTLVERRQTPFQLLEVYDTPDLGRIFRLDGFNMTSEKDEFFYHENLIHPTTVAHPDPKRALVIGGGDGGSCEELLKHSTLEVAHLAELDPDVIEIAKAQFGKVHRGVFDNPKLKLTVGDGLAYLKATPVRYDVISMDLTDPVGPSVELYSPATFALARGAMAPGGALTLHIGSPFSHPARVRETLGNLRQVFRRVTPYFVHIPIYGSIWGFACASDTLDPREVPGAEIDRRIKARGITDLQYYNGDVHGAVFALPNYVRQLVA
ncbi:polyamine aminopropyltransferase [Usitatibacter palustris]|uniref:Polyamine aminopropyltransferase n=1 Tax=Usitatibacter palustris TaxID=2732487 RepID=A0A6M4HA58_9PROT|nr:polyamine aminopropyltransferase [Usitatibacter palustris]QJR16431.1 Polyamine aminopropyltransferase [Usitatibacter palustris]